MKLVIGVFDDMLGYGWCVYLNDEDNYFGIVQEKVEFAGRTVLIIDLWDNLIGIDDTSVRKNLKQAEQLHRDLSVPLKNLSRSGGRQYRRERMQIECKCLKVFPLFEINRFLLGGKALLELKRQLYAFDLLYPNAKIPPTGICLAATKKRIFPVDLECLHKAIDTIVKGYVVAVNSEHNINSIILVEELISQMDKLKEQIMTLNEAFNSLGFA